MKLPTAFGNFFVCALFCSGIAGAGQDHNSSRSNKTGSIASPDSGTGTDATSMKVKEKGNRTKSMTTNES
jgi:hypothetical protein